MSARGHVPLALACGVALLCGPSCERPASGPPASARDVPAAPRAVEAAAVWHPLGTWSGRGSGQTGSFDVGTGSLRVTWEATATTQSADRSLTVVLHSAISGRPLQTVIDVQAPGTGTVFVQDEPRVSYLEVRAPGLDWHLSVEEMSQRPVGR